jgi:hypothetical protein
LWEGKARWIQRVEDVPSFQEFAKWEWRRGGEVVVRVLTSLEKI